jgi:hypothetical protein
VPLWCALPLLLVLVATSGTPAETTGGAAVRRFPRHRPGPDALSPLVISDSPVPAGPLTSTSFTPTLPPPSGLESPGHSASASSAVRRPRPGSALLAGLRTPLTGGAYVFVWVGALVWGWVCLCV